MKEKHGKIKVANKRQEITNEEVAKLMDFESVLKKVQGGINGGSNGHAPKISFYLAKISLYFAGVAVISTIAYFAFYHQSSAANQTAIQTDSAMEVEKSLIDSVNNIAALSKSTNSNKQEQSARLSVGNTQSMPAPKDSVETPSSEQIIEKAEGFQTDSVNKVTEGVTVAPEIKKEDQKQAAKNAVSDEEPLEKIPAGDYKKAEPYGGLQALYKHFRNELKYPAEASKNSVEGIVMVKFVIDKFGVPRQIKIQKSLCASCDKEAIRLVQSMKRWKPATLNKKPIASKYSIPITFQILKSE